MLVRVGVITGERQELRFAESLLLAAPFPMVKERESSYLTPGIRYRRYIWQIYCDMYIRGTSTTTTYSYFVVILQLYSYNIESRNVITIHILFKYHKLQYISEQSANTLECQVYSKSFDTALHRISKRECALPSSTAQPRSLSPPTWWALTRFVDSIHCSKALRFWCKLLSAIFVRSFACVGSTQADGGTTTVSRVAPAVRAKKTAWLGLQTHSREFWVKPSRPSPARSQLLTGSRGSAGGAGGAKEVADTTTFKAAPLLR